MAVATKTLTPTNQVVNLPDMTEPPDNSVNVDDIGKLADAVNVLNGKFTPTTVQNIGRSPGNANAVMVRKIDKIAFLVFNGSFYGFDLPSDCVPVGGPSAITFNQRNVLIAGIGTERWPAHIEGNMESVFIYIHKNGGETQLPADGTYNVFGTAIYITN